MKKYDFSYNNSKFHVYIHDISKKEVLVAVPELGWSYLFSYEIRTMDEFEEERTRVVRFLCEKTSLQYGAAERLVDLINEWI
uniref:YueH family protein n=1 Tax=Bacillus multifaciens TaxID=3068506 RepID=UPI003F49883E